MRIGIPSSSSGGSGHGSLNLPIRNETIIGASSRRCRVWVVPMEIDYRNLKARHHISDDNSCLLGGLAPSKTAQDKITIEYRSCATTRAWHVGTSKKIISASASLTVLLIIGADFFSVNTWGKVWMHACIRLDCKGAK
ncbi:hypothetical protein M378DRAFT_168436, partial [Amanita muscaria Koide BX008]